MGGESTFRMYVAYGRDGSREGCGRTSPWARFDAARSNLWTCFELDCWPSEEEGPVLQWCEELIVSKLLIEGGSIPEAVAAVLNHSVKDARRYVERVSTGLLDQVGEPPWGVLPQLRDVNGELRPVQYHVVSLRPGTAVVTHNLRRDDQGIWRICGYPVELGDQLEIYASEAVLARSEREGVVRACRDLGTQELLPGWLAGTVVARRADHLMFEPERIELPQTMCLQNFDRVAQIRMRGGRVAPVLDHLPVAPGESWRRF